MAVYTHLTNEQIAEHLLKEYGLAPLSFAVGITQGVENSNYLVAIKGKTGEQKYILTLYEKRVKAEDLPFFLELKRHLANRGVPCPEPLPRKNGWLYGELAGKAAALITFMPGHCHSNISVADASAVGKALALLHKATFGFRVQRENALSLAGWKTLYAKIASKLDTLAPNLNALVADELQYLEKHWPSRDKLPRGVIHADLFPDNVFFNNGNGDVSGIIDFYFACVDFQAYDLAITINAWCFDGVKWNAEKHKALLDQYQKVRSLLHGEQEAMSVLLRGAALRFLLTRAHDKLNPEPGALVIPHDPLEYVAKLLHHRGGA